MTQAFFPAVPPRFVRARRDVNATLEKLMAARAVLGVTRVADITGLDRIGMPVVQAARPFSLSNAVAQGKGTTLAEAAVSALMETAEIMFAERTDRFVTLRGSADGLAIPPGRFDAHVQPVSVAKWREATIAWTQAHDLIHDRPDMVPFDLVHTAYVLPEDEPAVMFETSTGGLAAAFEEADAVVHAILECVERDATARAHRTHGFFQKFRIDPATIEDASVHDLLALLASKGMATALWHMPSPTNIPSVWCHIVEEGRAESATLRFPAEGSAASPNPASAAAHAILEAAQSRLAAISGARDDMTRDLYPKYPDWMRIEAHRRLIAEGPRPIDFRRIEPLEVGADGTQAALLGVLERAGIDMVHQVGIDTRPLAGLHVVRVLIPQLLPMLTG